MKASTILCARGVVATALSLTLLLGASLVSAQTYRQGQHVEPAYEG